MKKNVFIILFFLAALSVCAEQYRIEDLNGDYIMYKGKRLVKGDVFEEKDSLCWQNSTAIIFMNTRTGNKDRLREEDLKPRSESSFLSYFFKTHHGSSRVCDDYCLCSMETEVLYLKDTLRLRLDDPDVIYLYLNDPQQVSLPDYYVSYWYEGQFYKVSVPLADDEMLITRQLFENVPLNQSVAVSIFSFDMKGNMRPTTNSVIVKII